MAINDPSAIAFLNQRIRRRAEALRAIKAMIDSDRVAYDGGMGDFFYGHGDEAIVDDAHREARSLVGNDVLFFNDLVNYQLKALLDSPGVAENIEKFCIRALDAQ